MKCMQFHHKCSTCERFIQTKKLRPPLVTVHLCYHCTRTHAHTHTHTYARMHTHLLMKCSLKWILLKTAVYFFKFSKQTPNSSPMAHLTLTHWGQVTHICISKLTIVGSDNGLSPGRRQAIIWTNAGILVTGPLGTNFSEILIELHTFSFTKMYWTCCLWNGSHFVSASMC